MMMLTQYFSFHAKWLRTIAFFRGSGIASIKQIVRKLSEIYRLELSKCFFPSLRESLYRRFYHLYKEEYNEQGGRDDDERKE